jgi:uncharacterized membrane protein YoaK (UPF0700 family)
MEVAAEAAVAVREVFSREFTVASRHTGPAAQHATEVPAAAAVDHPEDLSVATEATAAAVAVVVAVAGDTTALAVTVHPVAVGRTVVTATNRTPGKQKWSDQEVWDGQPDLW